MTTWNRKDLTDIASLTAAEIRLLLTTATTFKDVGAREIKKVPALRGKTLINFFVEASTRTRISFELAAFRLSADVVNMTASTSSLTKGETLLDTAKNLRAMLADIIILRHSSAGAAQFLAERLDACVINAGDGAHEHPTRRCSTRSPSARPSGGWTATFAGCMWQSWATFFFRASPDQTFTRLQNLAPA